MKRVSINFTVIPLKLPPRIPPSTTVCAHNYRIEGKFIYQAIKICFFFPSSKKVEYKTVARLLLNYNLNREGVGSNSSPSVSEVRIPKIFFG